VYNTGKGQALPIVTGFELALEHHIAMLYGGIVIRP
jgi:hypothetical protein